MIILMLRALGLGDFLTAVPAYRALARAYPAHCRIIAAPAALQPLVPLVGGIDALAPSAPLSPLDAGLWNADIAVNMHGKGPQSHRTLLDTRPRRLLAFENEHVAGSHPGPVWVQHEPEVARWCRMLAWYGIRADVEDLDLVPPPIVVPRNIAGATIVHVGAAAPARQWPPERWAAVVLQLVRDGERVFITGAEHEMQLAYATANAAGLPLDNVLAGRTSLLELAAVIASARRLLATDTGVSHLATAYRVPSVLLFGPTRPSEWGPPHRRIHRVLWKGTTGDPHAMRPDPGLMKISVDDVLRASKEVVLQGR